jgi:hypothetical protein
METPAAGPSTPDFLAQRRATLGDVVSRHRFWIGGAVNLLLGGFLGVVLGGGLTVLELMGEIKKPLFGVPLGLAFFGFGLWNFWQLRDDVGVRVEQRLLGLVFARAGDEGVIAWRDIAKVGWLQGGSRHLAEVHLDLHDGSRVKLPVERLSDRRILTAALSAKLGVQFPPH